MRHLDSLRLTGSALALASLSLAILTSADASAQERRRGSDGEADELRQFEFKVERFKAKSLGGSRARYGVYLPKGYSDKERSKKVYPWAIWLHGMRGSLYKFRDRGAAIIDQLRKDGKIPEMILITPSAGSVPLYMNGGARGDLEDMVLKEMWADVEKKFRVSKERHERAIMGISMGALGALKMALRFPEKFGSVAVHSGPVLPADPAEMSGRFRRYGQFMQIDRVFGDPVDKDRWAEEIPMALIQSKPAKAFAGLRIYIDAGSGDRYGFGPPNQQLSKALHQRGIKHTFNYIRGGGHSWSSGATQDGILRSFPFVGKGFATPPPKKPAKAKQGDEKK